MTTPLERLAEFIPAEALGEIAKAAPPPAPYSVRSWGELMAMDLPPRVTFLDGIFALNQLQAILGQGGVGKSRLATQLALCNVLGTPFLGLEVGTPQRWLFLGNENSIHRQQRDIRAMAGGLAPDQVQRLSAGVFFHTLETHEDGFICLGSEDVRKRYADTVEAVQPTVVSVDPFGEVQFGDPNDDVATRETLRVLGQTVRRVVPGAALLVLHHARTGRSNIGQAIGWDASNFGKGSKALYSGARAVINIAPGDAEDRSKIVVVCAKANDAEPFDPIGAVLNDQTMLYEVDPHFDAQAWADDVEGKRAQAAVSIADLAAAIRGGAKTGNELAKAFADRAASSTVKKWVTKGKKMGYFREGKHGLAVTGKYAGGGAKGGDVEQEF